MQAGTLSTLALLACSASLIHLTAGTIEMHFHIFVALALVAVYQRWDALATAIAVLDTVKASGEVPPEEFGNVVGRISFFVNAGMRFITEMCKMRAFVAMQGHKGKLPGLMPRPAGRQRNLHAQGVQRAQGRRGLDDTYAIYVEFGLEFDNFGFDAVMAQGDAQG